MRRRRRAIVVALDGVGIDLLRAAIAAGSVPQLAALAGTGGPRPVAALPPASPQSAWATFTTASNPGRHGIFGLTQPGRHLRIRVASADYLRMPTVWERAATDGLSSVVVGLPGTFPARRMSGSLVAGYVVASPERLCHPRSLQALLTNVGYRPDVDVGLAETDPSAFAAELVASVERRVELMRMLLEADRWSLAVLAFTELDRLGHAWGPSLAGDDDGVAAARDVMAAVLATIDGFVGELRAAHPTARLLVLSAHGVAPIGRLVNLDAWLTDAGHLQRDADGALGDGTVAFSMDGGRIYVHAARMFAEGRLGGGSVMPLMDQIADDLARLRTRDGATPLAAVFRRREIYQGPHARAAPHLVCVPAPGWGVVSSRELPLDGPSAPMRGGHRHDLAFVIGDLPAEGPAPRLEDVGATVLSHLGLYADDVDGIPIA